MQTTSRVLPGSVPAERFINFLPEAGEDVPEVLQALAQAASEDSEVLELRVFASRDRFQAIRARLMNIPGSRSWPTSLLDGAPMGGSGVAGAQLHLLQGADVEVVELHGDLVGTSFQRDGARYCILGGVGPEHAYESPGEQARSTILRMEEALESQGLGLKNLVRTWFFMKDILAWYPAFNEVRTGIFRDRGIFQGYVPASTGIAGLNHRGTALVASALAVLPTSRGPRVGAVPSPLQCPAGSYGSNFSRAGELVEGRTRRVLVSGTASIDPQGRTAHPGEVRAQIDLTLRVVAAILAERSLDFRSVFRGNAYFQDGGDADALGPALAGHGLDPRLLVVSQNTVCRNDLLFEMEVEAAATF